jgi:sulfur carrier protein ThiS
MEENNTPVPAPQPQPLTPAPQGMLAKIGQLPGRIEAVAFPEIEVKVEQALAVVGLNPEGFEIRVNGQPADGNTIIRHGDTVLLLRKIRGNQ